MRDFQDEVNEDLNGLAQAQDINFSDVYAKLDQMHREIRLIQNQRESDAALLFNMNEALGIANPNLAITYVNNMSETDDIFYHPSAPDVRRAEIFPDYRMILPPKNSLAPVMYTRSLDDRTAIVKNVETTIYTSIGTVSNWESGATVEPGDTQKAFHPSLTEAWVRKALYPLYSDVREVRMQLEVQVPQTEFAPNVFQLIPYPYGAVDILKIEYAPDTSSNYRDISQIAPLFGKANPEGDIEFVPIYNATGIMINFPPQNVNKIRITFAQRNSVDYDGRKLFEYGARFIGLSRIDYDPAGDISDPYSVVRNNNFLVRVSAPSGYAFDRLVYFNSDPYDPTGQHLRWQIAENGNFDDEIVWNSFMNLPQSIIQTENGATVTGIKLNSLLQNRREIWVKGILQTVQDPLPNSPFPTGVPAFTRSLTLKFTVQPTA
jgi:hypothetical protein